MLRGTLATLISLKCLDVTCIGIKSMVLHRDGQLGYNDISLTIPDNLNANIKFLRRIGFIRCLIKNLINSITFGFIRRTLKLNWDEVSVRFIEYYIYMYLSRPSVNVCLDLVMCSLKPFRA